MNGEPETLAGLTPGGRRVVVHMVRAKPTDRRQPNGNRLEELADRVMARGREILQQQARRP